ncbi:MAG: hypothetical protein A3G34_10760 [Candidatus Lindowbacteria bacterium RIFCSPLOWO2_12_FULL_62_27]|nr:MAG: hypothetical protein A3G34_10760 [Candidatus Lindowbacteria bacterium RIFCSPLOWO2_12_FULL_62_27]
MDKSLGEVFREQTHAKDLTAEDLVKKTGVGTRSLVFQFWAGRTFPPLHKLISMFNLVGMEFHIYVNGQLRKLKLDGRRGLSDAERVLVGDPGEVGLLDGLTPSQGEAILAQANFFREYNARKQSAKPASARRRADAAA